MKTYEFRKYTYVSEGICTLVRLEKEKRKSGITKVPYNPKTGKHAYVDNPDTFLISNPQYLQWLLYTYMKRKTPKKSSAELQKYRESYLTDDGVLAKAMASKQGENSESCEMVIFQIIRPTAKQTSASSLSLHSTAMAIVSR